MSKQEAVISAPGTCSGKRPLVAISSCLLGQEVRYDGGHRYEALIAETLGGRVDWLPVCPEVGAGLGAPRPPVHLVDTGDGLRAVGNEDPGLDITEPLQRFAREQLERLAAISGYIFKSRSPSCGLADTVLVGEDGRPAGVTRGLYARIVLESLPGLPVIDERGFRDAQARHAFVEAVFRRHARPAGGSGS